MAVVLAGPVEARWGSTVSTTLAVGFPGAYTTFSTFGYETVTLLRTDRLVLAAVYVAVSVVGGLAATGVGYRVGRYLS